MIAAVCCYIKY